MYYVIEQPQFPALYFNALCRKSYLHCMPFSSSLSSFILISM